jgi:hypothetical protein
MADDRKPASDPNLYQASDKASSHHPTSGPEVEPGFRRHPADESEPGTSAASPVPNSPAGGSPALGDEYPAHHPPPAGESAREAIEPS